MLELGKKLTYKGEIYTLVEMAITYNNRIRLTLQNDNTGKIEIFSDSDMDKKIFLI